MSNADDAGESTADDERQEAGRREQGVRTEDSDDLSAPQLTEEAEDQR
jgi:hypothetical protein